MSRRQQLLIVLISFTLGANHPARGEQPVGDEKLKPAGAKQILRTDLYGDPLPEGALARFGTIYLRTDFQNVAFRDDGREFYSWNQDGRLRVYDAPTGKVLRAFRLANPPISPVQFSASGRFLTLSVDSEAGGPWAKALTVWDTTTAKLLNRIEPTPGESFLSWDASLKDGRTLITCELNSRHVRVWNIQTGINRLLRKAPEGVGCLAASLDGKRLFVQLNESIECWNMADGKRVWENRDGGSIMAVSPCGRTLLVSNEKGDKAQLQVLDPATGKKQAGLRPPLVVPCWVGRWGADSKTLLISDDDRNFLLVWDLMTGKERARFAWCDVSIMAPDGKSVLGADVELQRWELRTKKALYQSTANRGHVRAPEDIACSPDGKVLVSTDQSGGLWFWDLRTSRLMRVMRNMNAVALTFTADGSRLIVGTKDNRILVCHPTSGKVLARRKLDGVPMSIPGIRSMTICEGNKLIINKHLYFLDTACVMEGIGPGGVTGAWDMETGKRHWLRKVEGTEALCGLSRDGRWALDWKLRLRDAESGRLVGRLGEKDDEVNVGPAGDMFSPDGSLMATNAYRLSTFNPIPNMLGGDSKYSGIEVWERATRRLMRRWPVSLSYGPFTFAPDGRRMAILRADELWVWDVARGKELLHLRAPESAAYWRGSRLAFVPNGQALVMATEDGSILLFAVPPVAAAAPAVLGDAQLRTAWETLADPDPAKAFPASADLADRPTQGVAFVKDRLKPVVPIQPEQVRRLIAALDADTFDAREAAERKLAALGPRVWPALHKVLGQRPSPEAKRRLERLLEAEKRPPSSDVLRSQRALRVLEWAGTIEARDLLRKLAAGDPDASLTQDAKAALRRLERNCPPNMPKGRSQDDAGGGTRAAVWGATVTSFRRAPATEDR